MKPPETRPRIHPLLLHRYSPHSFDRGHAVREHEVLAMLEAARWAPSAGNSQPWLFIPVTRGTEAHSALLPVLAPSSKAWAADASLLVLNFTRIGHAGLLYSEFADYDLGQAVAHMTVQAQAMALFTRQFRAFALDGATEWAATWFGVGDEWGLRTMTAVGRSLDPPCARERRDLTSLVPSGACHAKA